MPPRRLDELATSIDDASDIVEELTVEPETRASEKLDELYETLEEASDAIDDLENKDE